MRSQLLCFLLACPGLAPLAQTSRSSGNDTNTWYAWLETDGGPLGFGLEFEERGEGWRVYLVNEPERIPIDDVIWNERELRITIPHYDSVIEAEREGERCRGTWKKHRGKNRLAVVPFHARRGQDLPPRPMLAVLPKNLGGRWAVDFSSDELPAVGVFEQAVGSNRLLGTFLTATGDYRFLSGHVTGAELTLSCFDGAHAFLFKALLSNDGKLTGDFYSGNWWHETWTAVRDDDAELVDAFRQTSWADRASLADIAYPDTSGRLRNLGDPELRGEAYLLQVFGSWCPNCHDEARYLVELHERYRERGLSIVALAYELTGDFERDADQVEIFARRHGVTYPMLVAGTADKGDATSALGVLDRVRSYPTTIFLSGDGRVRAIHSGFAGPATGHEHEALRREFEGLIEELLSEEPLRDDALRARLSSVAWSLRHDGRAEGTLRFEDRDGALVARWDDGREEPVHLLGDAVFVGERTFRHDAPASVLLDATDFGRRGVPAGMPATPLLREHGADADFLARALDSDETLVVREAIVAAVTNAPEVLREAWSELALHESLEVRIAAAWAAGRLEHVEGIDTLAKNLEHPSAMLRRQSVRSLVALDTKPARGALTSLGDDPDPLIRALLQ